MEDKLTKQQNCDHHCYKRWHEYSRVLGNKRSSELDALFGVDLICECPFNKISCSFIDEIPKSQLQRSEHVYVR